MRNIKTQADAARLRAELAQAGLGAVEVSEPDAQGQVTVSAPDEVYGAHVDRALQRHARRLLVQRIRQAKPGTAEMRDAVADALESLL